VADNQEIIITACPICGSYLYRRIPTREIITGEKILLSVKDRRKPLILECAGCELPFEECYCAEGSNLKLNLSDIYLRQVK
jgi:hypothetical protein